MAASTISLAALSDDSGGPSAPAGDGTILNNTWFQSTLCAAINALFASGTFTLGGTLAVEGFGTHSANSSGTGFNRVLVANSTAGTGNGADFLLGNDASSTTGLIRVFSSTYTPSGADVANAMTVQAASAGGLALVASHATGTIRFFSGGTTERARFHASGGFSWGSTSDPGAGIFALNGSVSVTCGGSNALLLDNSSTYNVVSLNNAASLSTAIGIAGGASGDESLYVMAKTGGGIYLRVGGTDYLSLSPVGFTSFGRSVSVGDATDPGATNFRVAGTTALVGTVTISAALEANGALTVAGISQLAGTVTMSAALAVAGVVSVTGFATHAFAGAGTGANVLYVRNSTAGTVNSARISLGNNSAAERASFKMFSSTYTPVATEDPDGLTISAAGVGGITIASTNASATAIRFFVGGAAATNEIASLGVGAAGQAGYLTLTAGAFGTGAFGGGRLAAHKNTSGSCAPGYLQLQDKSSAYWNVFPDNSGNVRIVASATGPTEASGDTVGTVVGTQTSSLDSKHIHGWATDDTRRWALAQIVDTPIAEFTYRTQWPGERFHGLVTDSSPLFGLDRDTEHPGGKSLNEVMAHGCAFLAIQELARRVSALETR